MNYELRQACDYCTTDWSGGQTTQLYIYPEDGDYATRNFAVRISSATVETEESVFTPLPGVQRELMILEGAMTICHEGGSPKSMKPFCDVDSFSGDRETKSCGKVRDFNLMTQNGACGTLVFVETAPTATLQFAKAGDRQKLICYAISGSGTIGDQSVCAGEEVIVHEYDSATIPVCQKGEKPLRLAVCFVQLP